MCVPWRDGIRSPASPAAGRLNAGQNIVTPFNELSIEEWDEIVRVNCVAPGLPLAPIETSAPKDRDREYV